MNVRPIRYTGTLMLSMLLTACTDMALTTINTPSYLFGDVQQKKDLSYGEKTHQKLDLYLPPVASESRKQLIVFVYGGNWTSGAKRNYYFVADALTAAGYSVAIPDYIKYPQGTFPAFVEDIALSIAWLTQNIQQFTDIDELIIMGHSAGAHIGALLITDPRYLADHGLSIGTINAFVGLAGPYGFKPKEKKYQNIFSNMDDYRVMQPLHFVSGNEPPMLLLHGAKDTTVLPVNTRRFAEKSAAHDQSVVTHFYPDQGHAGLVLALSRVSDTDNTVLRHILQFLQR